LIGLYELKQAQSPKSLTEEDFESSQVCREKKLQRGNRTFSTPPSQKATIENDGIGFSGGLSRPVLGRFSSEMQPHDLKSVYIVLNALLCF
jgi:hypothetical protein